jgi:protein-S-isoprenylcysteine O-methyltransferase Ste14
LNKTTKLRSFDLRTIMDFIGKSPISTPVLIIGKVTLFACFVFFLVKTFAIDTMLYDSILTQTVGVVLYVGGLVILIVAIVQLGQSVAVGIPERSTELKTQGLYRLTRNPIYVGAFIMCAGSCLYAIHVVNFLLFAVAIGIHHQIVTKEEQFLEKRFGQQWIEYKQRVPRYVGRMRHTHTHHSNG